MFFNVELDSAPSPNVGDGDLNGIFCSARRFRELGRHTMSAQILARRAS